MTAFPIEVRIALANALAVVGAAVKEAELRLARGPLAGIHLMFYGEGSGVLTREGVGLEGDPDVIIFYSLDELVRWVTATDAERAELEAAERATRGEREKRDFAKLDAFMASQTGRIA